MHIKSVRCNSFPHTPIRESCLCVLTEITGAETWERSLRLICPCRADFSQSTSLSSRLYSFHAFSISCKTKAHSCYHDKIPHEVPIHYSKIYGHTWTWTIKSMCGEIQLRVVESRCLELLQVYYYYFCLTSSYLIWITGVLIFRFYCLVILYILTVSQMLERNQCGRKCHREPKILLFTLV